jgi:hypothetical protein
VAVSDFSPDKDLRVPETVSIRLKSGAFVPRGIMFDGVFVMLSSISVNRFLFV